MPPATRKKTTKKVAPKSKQSAARTWKRAKPIEVTVPSGQTCLVKRPGMEVFLLEGLMPDMLLPKVTEAINAGQRLKPADVQKIASTQEGVQSMMDMLDRITARIVIEPVVIWHKREVDGPDGTKVMEVIPEEERDDEQIYTDDIEIDDKNFLFQFAVGGTADLERFRREQSETVESVSPGEGVEQTA